jgi:hypothetical protein
MRRLTNFGVFTGLFALAGGIMPLMLGGVWHYFDHLKIENGPSYQYNHYDKWLTSVTFILWPSSIIELGEMPGNESRIFADSLIMNVLLYLVVGILLWLGVKKHKAFFAIPALVLIPLWGWLLSLR